MKDQIVANFRKEFPSGVKLNFQWQLSLARSPITVIMGPSGSGKSTLLRCMAGLEQPTQGVIEVHEQPWFDSTKNINLSPQERKIGYCAQDYALFPHLTIKQNIGFGCRISPDQSTIIKDLLSQFGLNHLADRYPHQISGGEQQRVALARAICIKPRFLLLDEPLSAVDEILKSSLRRQFKQLLQLSMTPVLMVSHDRQDALAMAHYVIVLDQGQVLMQGKVEDVFSRPISPRVAEIVGIETVVSGEILELDSGMAKVCVQGVELFAVSPSNATKKVHVCLRGEEVVLTRQSQDQVSSRNRLNCKVTALEPEGVLWRVRMDAGFPLFALVTKNSIIELGIEVGIDIIALIKVTSIHLISDD